MAKLTRRHWLAIALLGVGLLMVIEGFRAQGRPRSNLEDDISWCVWGIGISLTSLGVMILIARRVHPIALIAMAVFAPFVAFSLLVVVVWGSILLFARGPSQSVLVRTGYAQIPEANQIDELFGPASHMASNFKDSMHCEWITEELFGGRYELVMLVDVEFNQQGVTKVLGSPKFILREVASFDGQMVSYGQSYEFSADDWRKVVAANGDFSVIGINLIKNNPIPRFDEYQKWPRNGIQMKAR